MDSIPTLCATEVSGITESLNTSFTSGADGGGAGIGEILESVFLVFVSAMGTFGNILVIAAVCNTSVLRTRSNIFIIFLAAMDLITCSILAPFFILTLLNGGWPYADIYCKVLGYAALMCLAMSVTTLGLIAITRYVAVTRPKYVFRKQCNGYIILLAFTVLVTLNILIVILPEVVHFGTVGYNPNLGHCSMVCDEERDWWFCATLFMSGVTTTMVLTPAYYALTLWVVRKSRMTVAAINNGSCRVSLKDGHTPAGNTNRAPTLSREEIRLTKKLMILFLIFFICWVPYSIVILSDKNGIVPVPVHRFTDLFLWVNSCLNPYLYAWMMRSFRSAYKRVTRFNKWRKYLPCRKIRDVNPTSTSMTLGGTL